MASRSIKIIKTQGIDYIDINMPDGEGGVRLLRGRNGAGKTRALLCLCALLGRKVQLRPSKGAPKGTIEGMGKTITVQKRNAAKGEVDSPTLEGRFDFSELVEPSVKDPAARNKQRIQALVGLAGEPAGVEDFYELFGGQDIFEKVVEHANLPDTSDVVDLAAAIKKATEAAARVHEVRIDSEMAKWQVAIADSKGAKVDEEPPKVVDLANVHAAAQRARLEAEQVQRTAAESKEHNEGVAAKLALHNAVKPSETAEAALETLTASRKIVADLEAKLATAKAGMEEAKRRFDLVMQWEQRLDDLNASLRPVPQTLPELEPLVAAESDAMAALEGAEQAKVRWEAAVKADELTATINRRRESAEKLRVIAASVGTVVTKKLPAGCPLQVRELGEDKIETLCAWQDKRGEWVPFDELSEGERWTAAMQIAVGAVGEGGLIPLKQEAWQALDDDARLWVVKACQDAKVWIVSGEVAKGDLRVEAYEPAAQ